MSLTTSKHIRLVLYTQIFFVSGLLITGLIVIILSAKELGNILWSCPVLNTYYAVAWLSLILGVLQFCLGVSGALYLWMQPRCVRLEDRNLVLVSSNGRLGHIHPPPPVNNTNHWLVNLTPPKTSRAFSMRSLCCGSCDGQNVEWLRPVGILFGLVFIFQIVALAITLTFMAHAREADSGVAEQVFNIFTEAKVDLIHHYFATKSRVEYTPATNCWITLESQLQCCGAEGFADWFPTPSSSSIQQNHTLDLPTLSQIQTMVAHCGCSDQKNKNCLNTMITTNTGEISNVRLFQQGCSSTVSKVVLRDLEMLQIVLPISICVVLITFLVSLVVTLRVANLEFINNQPVDNVNALMMQSQVRVSQPHAHPDMPKQTKLSSVAYPALRAFSFSRAGI